MTSSAHQKLRVLNITTKMKQGTGGAIAVANMLANFDQSRFDLWAGEVYRDGSLADQMNVPADRIRSFGFKRPFYRDIPALIRLARFLRQERIQVVHTHLFEANVVGRVAALLAGVPVIIATEHNLFVSKSRVSATIDHILARGTTQMIAVSEGVRTFAARQARLSPERFMVIYNGVPLDKIPVLSDEQKRQKCAELALDCNRPIVLSAGRLAEQKGFPFLIHAARMVAQKHPDALFLVAGAGEHEDMLRQMIEAEQLTTHVRLLGYRNDVYELLQICTLFVMPSLWEGLGVVLLEAGACRVPVVATNVGGIPEVIEHSANGLLVPPKDEYALAEAIIQLLDNPEQRHAMAERGRQIVESQFSAPAIAEQMGSLYESLWEQHCAKNRSPQYSR